MIREEKLSARLEPQVGLQLGSFDLTEEVTEVGRENVYLRAELVGAGGDFCSENVTFFAAPRSLALARERIVHRWETDGGGGAELVLESAAFHYAVCLELEGVAVRWSDNFFHLQPGESRRIQTGLRTADVEAELARVLVYSLVDSYE